MPKVQTVTPFIVIVAVALAVTLVVMTFRRWGPTLLINETPSEPLGIYRLVPHAPENYQRGMYVIFPVPENLKSLVYGRGWMRAHVPFLKELLGLPGDRVCIGSSGVVVNEHPIGPVFERDSQGLALPQYPGCFTVQDAHFFAASRHLARSFDGRYFGPLPLAILTGEARPVWTF